MEQMQKFRKNYLQAPWRRQLQIGLTFLLVVVSVAIVAYIYLNVTTQAAAVGREIQYMQIQMSGPRSLTSQDVSSLPIEALKQNIANLEAQLGQLTSYQVMNARASQLTLELADPKQMLYLEVAGYQGQRPAVKAPPPEPVIVSAAGISPDFRESLVDWLKLEILQAAEILKEAQP